MGQYLSAPVTEKETVSGQFERQTVGVSFAVASQQGWRKTQEDAHIAVQLGSGHSLFGVFDGHGGAEVAKFCSQLLAGELEKTKNWKEGRFADSLIEVFLRMDDLMRSEEGCTLLEKLKSESDQGPETAGDALDILKRVMAMRGQNVEIEGDLSGSNGEANGDSSQAAPTEQVIQAGCTAIVALLHHDTLYIANAGDSRAVRSRGRQAIPMSEDHKPSRPSEKERIVAAGGFVSEIGGVSRVNGNLSLSRAIGDLRYKSNADLSVSAQIVTAHPEIEQVKLTPEDEFLVLACDGIWDVKTSQEVVDFVHERLDQGRAPTDIASELLDSCLASDPRDTKGIGCDNMTACIVVFDHAPKSNGENGLQVG